MISSPRRFLAALSLLLVAAAATCEAFQAPHAVVPARTRATELSAWTIMPTQAAPFSTWYNEYNPTARRTIYEEYVAGSSAFIGGPLAACFHRYSLFPLCLLTFRSAPLDYNFVALDDDWPTIELDTPTASNDKSQSSRSNSNRGPIRRMAKWGAGLVRRRS
jgi:hypothetical protein